MSGKFIVATCFYCFFISRVIAQNVKYTKVTNDDLVYILNNIERSIEFKSSTGDLFIKVYIVSDPSGSAKTTGTDEITDTIYIATSEDGEAPEQHLYKLTSVYDPKVISWTRSAKDPKLILSYGPGNRRRKVSVSIELKELEITKL